MTRSTGPAAVTTGVAQRCARIRQAWARAVTPSEAAFDQGDYEEAYRRRRTALAGRGGWPATPGTPSADSAPTWPTIRRARPADREAVRRFLDGLSPASSIRRFLAGGFRPTERMVDVLVGQDRRGAVFVATAGPDVVGHAMWAPLAGRTDLAEIAFVVADAWQGRGLGSRLALAAAADAADQGVTELEAIVLADNDAAQGLVRKLWGSPRQHVDHETVEYRIPLAIDHSTDRAA